VCDIKKYVYFAAVQFIYPTFLFALSAISIPIIIHLFNFRRYKKIIFSDIRFLLEVQEETKSKQKLKEWLILICRILTISFLVFAFAQPFIPNTTLKNAATDKNVSIYIDNSFSMGNESESGTLLESAKNKARGIINAYENDVKFQILTNDFEGKQQHLISKNDALKSTDEIQISSQSKNISSVLNRQKQVFENNNSKHQCYIISDFQKNFTDINQLNVDSNILLNFVPINASVSHNISIDSAWLESPVVRINQPLKMKVRIRNFSNNDEDNIAVTLKINNIQKALIDVKCGAQQFTDAEINFTLNNAGWHQGELSIIDHPVTFDDKLFIAFATTSVNNILCINHGNVNNFINKVYEGDDAYKLINTNENQIDYSTFNLYKLIIINEPVTISSGLSSSLIKYISDGGSLLIIPPQQSSTKDINTFLASINSITYELPVKQNLKADKINIAEEILSDVFNKVTHNIDLPTVNQYYETSKSSVSKGIALIQLNNGLPFIYQSNYKKGNVFLFTIPLNTDWSNLPQHAVFVPLMLKIGMGNNPPAHLYYTMGKDKNVKANTEWKGAEKILHIIGNGNDMLTDLKSKEGNNEFLIENGIQKSGIYKAEIKDQTNTGMYFALNYNRTESDVSVNDMSKLVNDNHVEVLNNDATVIGHKISQGISETRLWRVCLIMALLFVSFEILLLKLL